MAVLTYYFNGSDAAPTDPGAVWTNDAEAFTYNTTTNATTTTQGSLTSLFLMAEGTSAPSTGVVNISSVRTRMYAIGTGTANLVLGTVYTNGLGSQLGSANAPQTAMTGYGAWTNLLVPSGGWTWANLHSLEIKIYLNAAYSTATVYFVELEATTVGAFGRTMSSSNSKPYPFSPGLAR